MHTIGTPYYALRATRHALRTTRYALILEIKMKMRIPVNKHEETDGWRDFPAGTSLHLTDSDLVSNSNSVIGQDYTLTKQKVKSPS